MAPTTHPHATGGRKPPAPEPASTCGDQTREFGHQPQRSGRPATKPGASRGARYGRWMAWTNVYRRCRITWSDVHGVDVEFSSGPDSGDKSRLRFYSGPDRRPVVVDAAVKTDGQHGTYVKSATRALGNASPTSTDSLFIRPQCEQIRRRGFARAAVTSRVVASAHWTAVGAADHRRGGCCVQPWS
jgi:hypothetical protein